jgi:hypothetical protein
MMLRPSFPTTQICWSLLRILRRDYGLTVGLVNPQKRPSKHLRKNTDFVKQIRRGPLRACQFPPTLSDAKGPITKPPSW